MTPPPPAPPDQAAARRLGQLQADQFDQRLREDEQRELAARWPCVFAQPLLHQPSLANPQEMAARLRESQAEAERFERFHRAVSQSLGWRVLQALRRPFGRTW